MNGSFFQTIDFDEFKKSLSLDETIEDNWELQENGIMVKPLITSEKSEELNITYVGLIFYEPTDGHYYKTQTDTIYFKNSGQIEFSIEDDKREIHSFKEGDAIQILPSIIRKIIPEKELEIELIVKPAFKPSDEIKVYD